MAEKRILVLCVDRDADFARKAGIKGPVYGRETALDAATRLALADPRETDANTLFEAIRIHDDFRKSGKEVEVALIQGDPKVGVVSDMELSRQLEEVAFRIGPEEVVVVTDGAEDEYILPLIQSRFRILTLRRVVVKQSEHLESTYYIIQGFLKEIIEDPKLSRLVLGLPAITLVLIGLFGERGWRLIVGTIGVFLFIKGFNLEDRIQKAYEDFRSSFISGRMTSFAYAVAVVIGILALSMGYTEATKTPLEEIGLMTVFLTFVTRSIGLMTFAAVIALLGKCIDAIVERRSIRKYLTLMVFAVALKMIIDSVGMFLLGEIDNLGLGLSIAVGFTLSFLAFLSLRSSERTVQAAA
jgi:putative membrane protein